MIPKDPRRKKVSFDIPPKDPTPPPDVSNLQLCPVESLGSLVAISPRLILQNPEGFRTVMDAVRGNTSWGAYITPEVVIALNYVWLSQDKNLCPNIGLSFGLYLQYLFNNGGLLKTFSPTIAHQGGLTVSCEPPRSPNMSRHLHLDACSLWQDWQSKLASPSATYPDIIRLCQDVSPSYFDKMALHGQPPAEQAQAAPLGLEQAVLALLRDIVAIKTRTDVVEYEKCVYVEEVPESVQLARRAQLETHQVESMTPANFVAMIATSTV
ncbi:hypothetical protein IAT38_003246 [Cryptococcus sp. DSM 104549]